ncbi:MAG: hypothetical protein UY15_C0005G0045 [Parcubacteria group bacterium GW2011_GWA2_47_9]|nr:MAG: hypothetical protein UY15_C0005G0045 [Parcubacteria group bacterium GW2011_GWA2_47_9]
MALHTLRMGKVRVRLPVGPHKRYVCLPLDDWINTQVSPVRFFRNKKGSSFGTSFDLIFLGETPIFAVVGLS